MIKENQIKSKRANFPNSNDTLVYISTKAMLSSDDFYLTTKKWEHPDTANNTWFHWKDDYSKADTKRALQIKESGDGDLFGSANLSHQA